LAAFIGVNESDINWSPPVIVGAVLVNEKVPVPVATVPVVKFAT
jgi:hypothetical protein